MVKSASLKIAAKSVMVDPDSFDDVGEFNPDDLTSDVIIDDDPTNWQRQNTEPDRRYEGFEGFEEEEEEVSDNPEIVDEVVTLFDKGDISEDQLVDVIYRIINSNEPMNLRGL